MLMLSGASGRLLPPAVPILLFGAMAVFQLVFWGLVAAAADTLALGGLPGMGPGLAAIHALTIGCLVCAVFGAGLQILPVVGQTTPPPVWAVGGSTALVLVGCPVFLGGVWIAQPALIHAGTTAIALAILGLLGMLLRLVHQVSSPNLLVTRVAGWMSVTCLAVLTVFAVLLVADSQLGFLENHSSLALSHALLAIFGFMGYLVLGFGEILVPMLAIAEPPPRRNGMWCLGLAAVGLVFGVLGIGLEIRLAQGIGLFFANLAVTLHIVSMQRVVAKGLSRDGGMAFILVRLGWISLVGTMVVLNCGFLGWIPRDLGISLTGWLALVGWLLSLLTGLLQRIMPFLASMHTVGKGKRAMSPQSLAWKPVLVWHAAAHGVAVGVGVLAMILSSAEIMMVGAGFGMVGSVAFMMFAATVLRRCYRHLAQRKA